MQSSHTNGRHFKRSRLSFVAHTRPFFTHTRRDLSQLSAISLLTMMAGSVFAQQTATANDPAVQEILIRERSIENTLPLELARFGADLEVITEEQVRNHGFVDVAQSLEMLVPGLHLTTQAGAFSYVNVQLQGSRASDILWTLDGVRINNRLYNSTSPADTLPSSMIERMEVLKGSHGLMYGTQAIAGVINVVTRDFSETTDGSVTLGAGSHGQRRINGYIRGALGDHKLVAWASKDQTDGYEIYDNYQPSATRQPGISFRQGSAPGDLMFYSIHNNGNERGTLLAPFDGIHGWDLKNESLEEIVVKLKVAGFYEDVE